MSRQWVNPGMRASGVFSEGLCVILFNIVLILMWSCLAHIINLVTQALLHAHSNSKEYNPQNPDVDLIAEHGGHLVDSDSDIIVSGFE